MIQMYIIIVGNLLELQKKKNHLLHHKGTKSKVHTLYDTL